MPLVTGIFLYFVLWWLIIFIVLPWGVKGQAEEGEVIKGSEPGAPVKARMKRKAIQTTIVTAIVWVIIFIIVEYKLIDINNIPFIPDYSVDMDSL